MSNNTDDEEEKSPYARTPADFLKAAGYDDEAEAIQEEEQEQKTQTLDKHRHTTGRSA